MDVYTNKVNLSSSDNGIFFIDRIQFSLMQRYWSDKYSIFANIGFRVD